MKEKFSLKKLLRAHPEYWYILFVPCYLICFFLVERLVPSDCDYWVSYLPLDDKIPFLEGFVFPYCMWYPLLLFVGIWLMLRDVPQFKKYMHFLILGFGFTLVFCLVFPNGQNLRPLPFERQNFCTWLLGRLYAADTNTNVLPSMHVIGCAAAAAGAFSTRCGLRKWRWPIAVLSLLICASTVFVKQHSILDMFAGIAVSIPIYLILYVRKGKGAKACRKEKAEEAS